MRDLKYIIILIQGFEPRAILFNGLFNHSDIWLGAKESVGEAECISAGLCSISKDLNINCHGGSDSLTNLLKKPIESMGSMDAMIISKTLKRTFFM